MGRRSKYHKAISQQNQGYFKGVDLTAGSRLVGVNGHDSFSWNTGDAPTIIKVRDLDKVGTGGTLYLHRDLVQVIKKLCREVEYEWQMLLKGAMVGDDTCHITDYYIPKQIVSPSTVKNDEVITPQWLKDNGFVATIHSHSSMGVFYSSTDDDMTNLATLRIHAVVNNKLEFVAIQRWDLPGGAVTFLPMKIEIIEPADTTEVVGINNIEKTKYEQRFLTGAEMTDEEERAYGRGYEV